MQVPKMLQLLASPLRGQADGRVQFFASVRLVGVGWLGSIVGRHVGLSLVRSKSPLLFCSRQPLFFRQPA